MNALIFGIAGQDGTYLKKVLEKNEIRVIGVSRSEGWWIKGNVDDTSLVEELIKSHKPTYLFHLAANSTTRHETVFENHQTIVTGTLNILEACYRHSNKTKIFLSGSAVQFLNEGKPINELTPFEPLSAYAVSRISSVYAGRYYRSLGMQVFIGYFFNHDSPFRSERHVNQKIIAAVKRIAEGKKDIVEVGNLSTKKEFNYAGDVVEAVWKLVNQDQYAEAVIGNGEAFSIQQWVEVCFGLAGLNWRDHIVEKADYVPEYQTLVSDPTRIKSIGWKPKVSFEGLARLMYYA